jgi:3-deoxy-7-phosphoheptulonate synthase
MIIVMRPGATVGETGAVVKRIEELKLTAHVSRGQEATVIGVVGEERAIDPAMFETLAGVERVMRVLKPFKLASRDFRPADTQVRVDGIPIGEGTFTVMAGPCAVETRAQTLSTARAVARAGAVILRGGAFKPRTSPYSFQGLGEEGLKILREAADETGLKVVTEVMSLPDVPTVARYADILQIGARNMQNYNLLDAVGRQDRPVLLKRGLSSTVEELLLSAEYILSRGNGRVILCERGIRTFERYTRNTLDISVVPVVKKLTHLPIVIDPSHACGHREYVAALARAAVAAGADGMIVEVHPEPEKALCDGQESLLPQEFEALMGQILQLAEAMGKKVPRPAP